MSTRTVCAIGAILIGATVTYGRERPHEYRGGSCCDGSGAWCLMSVPCPPREAPPPSDDPALDFNFWQPSSNPRSRSPQ